MTDVALVGPLGKVAAASQPFQIELMGGCLGGNPSLNQATLADPC